MGLVLALLAAVLWGFTPVAIKGSLPGFSPALISVVRLAIATVVFRMLGGRGTRWLPSDRWTLLAGVALGADFVLYNYGVGLTTAALASLVVNVEVVSTIVFARWLLDERLTFLRIAGATVTLAGALYVATEGAGFGQLLEEDHVLGNVVVMLAGVLWSFYAVAQRRAPRGRNIFQVMTPLFAVATLTTVPTLVAPGTWNNPGGLAPTLMLATLIVLSTIGVYLVYARSQELLDVSVLAVVLTSIPIFSIVLAWLLLGESVSSRALVGGTVILAGVLIIARERPVEEAAAGGPD
ncbi:MAG TPA: DMT family transporter [Candidatus Binatia bacterium]|nr:DMT family transporter [Candidatus Binatia bacterium]